MNKLLAKFEYIVNEKVGTFLLDYDTPISEAKQMVFGFLKSLGKIEDDAKAALEKPHACQPSQEDEGVKE